MTSNGNGARRASSATEVLLRSAATRVLEKDKLSFRDARLVFEAVLVDWAVKQSPKGKSGAAAVLGLSRRHVQKLHERAKELLR